MSEELLLRCVVQYKRSPFDLLLTADRMVLHPSEGRANEAEIFPMQSLTSFVPNKPRPDLKNQKVLLKLTFANGSEIVLDFQDSAANQRETERVFREHAGERGRLRAEEAARVESEMAKRRAKFLHDRPALRLVYESLVEKEKSLTPAEFWKKYENEVETYTLEISDTQPKTSLVPEPLSREVTSESKRKIFFQFPDVEKLYKSAVPDLVSESDFWRRFHSCQFFWKSQGKNRETAKDVLFDSLLLRSSQSSQPVTGLRVSPAIDLSTEIATRAEPNVSDAPFASLVSRFNAVGQKAFGEQISDSLERTAELRVKALEEELDMQIPQETIPGVELTKLVASYRQVRPKDGAVWSEVLRKSEIPETPGGANEMTMFLSQHLRNVEDGEEKLNKWGRAMLAADFDKDFDFLAEQVNELLRHFWASDDNVKRSRILAALLKKRLEVENLLGKVPPLWTASLKSLQVAIDVAEKVARKVASTYCVFINDAIFSFLDTYTRRNK